MTLSKEKFDHILAYAKQQQNLGVHHCNILPDDMVAIMEMAAGKQERRERDKQEPVALCDERPGSGGISKQPGFNDLPHGTPLYAAPPAPDIGDIRVGRLPTMNQDEYPGLGDWWVQLRIGEDSGEVLARVYGATPQEAKNRAEALACRAAMHGETISNSADFAIDEAGQSFGNSEQLNSPAVPDGWVAVPAKHTSAMYYAGGELISKHNFNPGDIWQAMLAAAPKQESE